MYSLYDFYKDRPNELCHYGRKGMKWYQHIFGDDPRWGEYGRSSFASSLAQNSDGTFTYQGMQVYKRFSDKYRTSKEYLSEKKARENHLASCGILKVSLDTDIVNKGTKIYRMTASPDEPLDHQRKYAAITPKDAKRYKQDSSFLPIKGKEASQKVYEASKKLRVANASAVRKFLDIKVGSQKVSDFQDLLEKNLGKETAGTLIKKYGDAKLKDLVADEDLRYGMKKKIPEWLGEELFIADQVKRYAYDKELMNSEEVYKHFKSKGYDAIVDTYDMDYAEYPVVILDPADSLLDKR